MALLTEMNMRNCLDALQRATRQDVDT